MVVSFKDLYNWNPTAHIFFYNLFFSRFLWVSILEKLDELKEICARIFIESLYASKTKNENNLIVPLLCNVYINVIYGKECYRSYLAVQMDQQDPHTFI